ncbi:hypothetical protein [Erwinia amylovora]
MFSTPVSYTHLVRQLTFCSRRWQRRFQRPAALKPCIGCLLYTSSCV